MNTILIVADTWRRDHMGCYGNDWIRTPNVDRLAERGTVMENCCFSSYPTLPCRHDIITGRYTFPWQGWRGPAPDAVTLSGILDKAGKVSYLITDIYHHWRRGGGTFWWDFSGFELIRGQERDRWFTDADIDIDYPAPEYRGTPKITPHLRNTQITRRDESDWFAPQVFTRACRWIRHNASHEDFFLMVDAFDPHEPWDPPAYYTELYDPGYTGDAYVAPAYREIEGYLTPEEFRHVQALYAGEITMVDRWMGRFLREVEDLGLMENTLVIVTTDHGTYNGDHGLVGKNKTLYRGLSHTPMIVRHPQLAHGGRLSSPVQPVDIFPTVLEAAGLEVPDGVHGASLLPLLEKGDGAPWRKAALFGQHDKWCNVTDGEYVLHRRLAAAETMLFHLPSDPGEERNLADSEPDQLERMRGVLHEKLRGIEAPRDLLARLGPKRIG